MLAELSSEERRAGRTAAAARGELDETRFESLARDGSCPHCADCRTGYDWSFLDGVYCISLRSRPDRAARAARELHRVGLCSQARFYRPDRDHELPARGIWESHRTVARHALGRGLERVLVLEDDVRFARWIRPRTVARVRRALETLPADWRILYLGHLPLRAYPVGLGVLRTRSGCAHAYIANRELLRWLAATPFAPVAREVGGMVGRGIDAAYRAMPGAYAVFPMLAVQAPVTSDHMATGEKPIRRLKHLITRSPLRPYLLSFAMRPAEWAALMLSPLWWWLEREERRA